ncbi:MAG TPA: hypothetical protein VES20_12965, partial [Bryobacteraceae bacterium]|nr:hypothetical protein [Bryobacteraceae bacterium]
MIVSFSLWSRLGEAVGYPGAAKPDSSLLVPGAFNALRLICRLTAFALLLPLTQMGATPGSPGGGPQTEATTRTLKLPVTEGHDIRFRRLSNPQQLSQVRASEIVQDAEGFIWFGTWNGLNRYDGYKVKVFRHDPANPHSLS